MEKKKRTHKPVQITDDVWFYVNEKTLDFVVWSPKRKNKQRECVQFRIKHSKLLPFVG